MAVVVKPRLKSCKGASTKLGARKRRREISASRKSDDMGIKNKTTTGTWAIVRLVSLRGGIVARSPLAGAKTPPPTLEETRREVRGEASISFN